MLDERQAVNGLTLLARLAQREPEKRELLRKALDADLIRLAPLALRVGLETGEPMPSVLADVLAVSPVAAEAAARVADVLPLYTASMVELAVQVTRARTRSLQPGSPELAIALVDHAQFLTDVGRADEARLRAWKAVELLRTRGDDAAGLARALWAASRAESLSGFAADALKPAQEAVTIQRIMAGDRASIGLAVAVLNLADRLASAGEDDDALASYTEAIDLYRTLIQTAPRRLDYQLEDAESSDKQIWINLTPGPDSTPAPVGTFALDTDAAAGLEPSELRRGLSTALMGLSDSLLLRGRRSDAIAAAEEAVELLRDLAADQPDAYRLHLAGALTSQANALVDSEPEQALTPAREAADLLRTMSKQHPGAVEPHLGRALLPLSVALVHLRRWKEALATTAELGDLGWADQDDALQLLVTQFEEISSGLASDGDSEAAVTASRYAVAAARRLAPAEDDVRDATLGAALHNLSRRLRAVEDHAGACAASAEAVGSVAPQFLHGGLDPEAVVRILWQYAATCESVSRPLDAALPLAPVLTQLFSTFHSDARFVEPLAKLAFDSVEAYRSDDDIDEALNILGGLLRLAHSQRDQRAPRVSYALAGFNVVHDLLARNRTGDAEKVVEQLIELSAEGDPIVVGQTGKGAFILLGTYTELSDNAAAARIALLAESQLRSDSYLQIRREELKEASPTKFLSALDELVSSSTPRVERRRWPLRRRSAS